MDAKALRIRAFWSDIGRTPECPACETPEPVKSHARECKAHQDIWEESRQTARAEEAKRGVVQDSDPRPLNPSSSSTDPKPRTTADDAENTLDWMDVDSVQKDIGNTSSSGTCK